METTDDSWNVSKKCVNEDCQNFGNEENAGKCNRCFYQWKPPGPNYSDKPVFPPPFTLTELAIKEGKPKSEIEKLQMLDKQRLEMIQEQRKKSDGTQGRNRVGVSLDDDFMNYYDPEDVLNQKVNVLEKLFKQAKTIVVYTGAGISTSAGISDYRSWDGAWTSRLLGTQPKKSPSMDTLRPTLAHMALAKLCSVGIVQLIVSSNVDNLHRRSGIPREKLSELHGNCYKEICSKCSTEYFRPTRVQSYGDHITGNKCQVPNCSGNLMDSIIHFGENLPEKEMKKASEWSKKADIALVLGSSLRVKPACWLTEYCYSFGNDGKIVICNLQITDYESKSYLSLFSETDVVMAKLMEKLGLEIPPYDPSLDPTEQLKLGITIEPSIIPSDVLENTLGTAVTVSKTCPHAETDSNENCISKIDDVYPGECTICSHPAENWFCLTCGNTSCGRHIKGHALSHFNNTGHGISISFQDLSCWCYKCNDYIEDERTNKIVFALHKKKFGTQHPKF